MGSIRNKNGFISITWLIILGFVLIAGSAYWYYVDDIKPLFNKQVACTMEAKLCPDGSSVGRTGPNCEFAACPNLKSDFKQAGSATSTADWKTYTNSQYGFELKYPNNWSFNIESQNHLKVPFLASILFLNKPDSLDGVTINIITGTLKERMSLLSESINELDRRSVQINGIQWLIISSVDRNSPRKFIDAFVEQNGLIYQVASQDTTSKNQEFNQILSTFKFTK